MEKTGISYGHQWIDEEDPRAVIAALRSFYITTGHLAYAMTRKCILRKKNTKGDRTSFVIIHDFVVNIDTELDFKLAEFMLQNLEKR